MSETSAVSSHSVGTRVIDIVFIVAAAIALWQGVYAYAGDSAVSSPLATIRFLGSLLSGGLFWNHASATVLAFLYSLVISILLGVPLGLLLGLRRFAGDVSEPMLAGLYSIPKVTLYPMILLIFGLGLSAKVAFGVIHAIIPIILITLNAVKNASPVMLKTARVMKLSQTQTITTVLAPSVMPELVTALRIGFSLTMLGVLIGEMFASQRGLGFLIINGIAIHNVQMTTAVILVVVVFALAANSALLALDRRMHRRL